MILGDEVTSALVELRAQAESRMRDSCTIRGPDGEGAWDEASGSYVPAAGSVLYQGVCRVQRPDLAQREVVAGDASWSLLSAVVSIPVSVGDVPVGSVVTVDAAEDASLVGRMFSVESGHAQSQATARRLRCVEVTRG